MIREYKVLCTICARGGSKGVKNKNIRDMLGKPLIAYTIEQALNSGLFEHVVISTDSSEIADTAKKHGGEVFFKRDDVLANDTAGKLDVIRDAFVKSEEHYGETYDYLIDLDATSPLRDTEDIKRSFAQFLTDGNHNLITAMPARRNPYFNLIEKDKNGQVALSKKLDSTVARRQDAPACFDMNASIYVWRRDTILNQNNIFLENTGLYVMPEERSIDIDSELDFEIVEMLMRKKHAEK